MTAPADSDSRCSRRMASTWFSRRSRTSIRWISRAASRRGSRRRDTREYQPAWSPDGAVGRLRHLVRTRRPYLEAARRWLRVAGKTDHAFRLLSGSGLVAGFASASSPCGAPAGSR